MRKKPAQTGWKLYYTLICGVGLIGGGIFLSQGKSLTWIGMLVVGALLLAQGGWQLYKQGRPE